MATNGHQQPKPEVHVSSNLCNSLDELFNVSLSQSNHNTTVPMNQRKFPASFFRPPSSACSSATHSRESSLDAGAFSPSSSSTNGKQSSSNSSGKPPTPSSLSPASPPQQQHPMMVNNNGKSCTTSSPPSLLASLVISHSRARSLPATLQQTAYSNQQTVPNVNLNPQQLQGQQATNVAQQGQPSQLLQVKPQPPLPNVHIRQHSYDINKLQLPEGWSVAFTPNGDQYFLNHNAKVTTWEDPRKELLRRRAEMFNINTNSPMFQAQFGQSIDQSINTVPAYPSQSNVQQVLQSVQSFDSAITPNNNNNNNANTNGIQNQNQIARLPDGWEQGNTPNGDVYYVNHNDQTTTWFHPSLPRQLQLKGVQLKQHNSGVTPPSFMFVQQAQNTATTTNGNGQTIPSELVVALENMNTSESTTTTTTTNNNPDLMRHANIRDLELERERMRQRQEELFQSPLLKNNNFVQMNPVSNQLDPFLSSTIDCSGIHGRQESIDSGLSLGSTAGINGSQLMLNHFDLNNHNQQQQQQQQQQLHHQAQHQFNMDQTKAMDHYRQMNGPNSMSSLVSNQQVVDANDLSFIDSIDLDMDMLTEVEELLNSNRDNIMTWL
ncbi:DNA-binding transcription factor yap1 [Blomia tropicalis]|nr:DNA-binding transcription factor yap1 [Blomia tropicalis]